MARKLRLSKWNMSFAAGTKAWPVMAHAMVAKRVNCSKMSSRHLEGNPGSD